MAEANRAPRKRMSRQESQAVTRARLLEAAGEVFAERGFHGASVEDITDRAGFSRGAFYSNFESREELFLAVLDAYLEVELAGLDQALANEASAPGALLEFLRARAVRRSTEGRHLALLWSEFWLHVVRNPELGPKLAARQRAGRAAIAHALSVQAQRFGFALPAPAEDLAAVMMAVDDGLVLQEFLDPAAIPDDLRARAAGLLFRGMAAESAASHDVSPSEPGGGVGM